MLKWLTNFLISDTRIFLPGVRCARLLGQPALVPGGGGGQLARHRLLLSLLPLPGRATQQVTSQLADGGECSASLRPNALTRY